METQSIYEIRIESHLKQSWSSWFEGLEIHHEENGNTVLRGLIVDQAALHGVLVRIRDLGLALISVNRITSKEAIIMETREQVIEFIKDVKFAYLATLGTDNAPRVRPLGAYTVYGDALYFFTFRTTRKVAEITAHPQAEMVWARMEDNAQVRMRGAVTLEEDTAIQERFKADNPMVGKMLPPGAEHLFALFKMEPEVVEAVVGLKPYNQVAW